MNWTEIVIIIYTFLLFLYACFLTCRVTYIQELEEQNIKDKYEKRTNLHVKIYYIAAGALMTMIVVFDKCFK
jgi:hypothetical protein